MSKHHVEYYELKTIKDYLENDIDMCKTCKIFIYSLSLCRKVKRYEKQENIKY